MAITRRGFLAGLAALPVVGVAVKKAEPKTVSLTTAGGSGAFDAGSMTVNGSFDTAPNLTELVTKTLRQRAPELVDNVTRHNALLDRLRTR